MNNRVTDMLRGISVLISDISVACLLLVLIPLEQQWDFYAAVPVWAGCICLQFFISYTMLSAGIPVNFYLIFNGAAAAGSCWLVLRHSYCVPGWENMKWFLGSFAILTGMHSAWASWRLPESNRILRYVDTQVILLAFYLYTEFYCGYSGGRVYTFLPLAAMVLDLLTVNRLRTGGEQSHVIYGAGAGGKVLLIMIGGGCIFFTAIIVGYGSEEIHSAVDAAVVILGYLWSVVNFFARIAAVVMAAIVMAMIWLLPSTPRAARENMQSLMQENMDAAEKLAEEAIPVWVFQVLLALLFAAVVGWILYQYRGKSIKRLHRTSRRRSVVRKSRLWTALKEAVWKLRERAVFEMNYWRYKKTPQGLLVLAEQVGKKHRLPRGKQESPGEYLRRLAGEAIRRENTAEETVGRKKAAGETDGRKNMDGETVGQENIRQHQLYQLADVLDRIYYAGETDSLRLEKYLIFEREIRKIEQWS